MRGPRVRIEGSNPIHINVNVEPINPCATNTLRRKPPFKKLNFGRRKTSGSTSTQGTTTGELVQEALVKYLHCAEVVVQHSGWKDMSPPSGYQNSKEKCGRTRRSTYLSVKRFREKNISLMRTLKFHS